MRQHTTKRESSQESSHAHIIDNPFLDYTITYFDNAGLAAPPQLAAIFTPKFKVKEHSRPQEKHEENERLFSIPKAAKYLGRTTWSMRHLIEKGSIPIVREGKRIFFDVKDLDKYIERNKVNGVEPSPSRKVLPQAGRREGDKKRG